MVTNTSRFEATIGILRRPLFVRSLALFKTLFTVNFERLILEGSLNQICQFFDIIPTLRSNISQVKLG